MNTSPTWLFRLVAAVVAAALVPAVATADTPPSGITGPGSLAPAQGQPWGMPKAGLECSAVQDGPVQIGKKIRLKCALRNLGSGTVVLAKGKKIFGWFLLVTGTRGHLKALFTEKIYPEAKISRGWLQGGQTYTFASLDLTDTKLYEYKQGMELSNGYPAAPAGSEPAQEGTLGRILTVGEMKIKMVLYVPRDGERALLLVSNTANVLVQPPALNTLPPRRRKAFVDHLIARFDKDPWAGQAACGEAVKLGKDVIPDLATAIATPGHQGFSVEWMTTALCEIRDPLAADHLIKLLAGKDPDVLYVIAYYGAGQHSDKLDQALIKRIQALKDTPIEGVSDAEMTALAVLGYMSRPGGVPDAILKAGLDSKDPQTRSAVVEAFAGHASETNVLRAVGLLKDTNERVRATAARVLGGLKNHSPVVLAGLVSALDLPGDYARMRICNALDALTGQNHPYDPKAKPAARNQVIRQWKDWWAKNKTSAH